MFISVVISAFLFYLSFPNVFHPFGLWPLAWLAAVPLLVVLDRKPLGRRLWTGCLFGLLFYLFLVSWFIPYTLAGYLLFVLVLSIQPVLFAAIFPCYFPSISRLVYWPSAWVASEFVRTLFLKGFSWNLGHSQSFNLFPLQIAPWTGAWGISFVLILFNACMERVLRDKRHRTRYAFAACLTVILVFGYGWLVLERDTHAGWPGLRVVTIQPNITPLEKIDRSQVYRMVDQQVELTQTALSGFPADLVIWPETAIPTDFRRHRALREQIEQLVRQAQSHFLVGAALSSPEGEFNSAVLLDSNGQVTGIYQKRFLVPFSEYLPGRQAGLPPGRFREFLKKSLKIHTYEFLAGTTADLLAFQRKDEDGNVIRYAFGAVICNEDTLGHVFREFRRKGAQFAVVLLNDAWFRQDSALIMHAENSIMHAVENRLPMVRAANTGFSCFIDPYGRIFHGSQDRTPALNTRDFSVHFLQPNDERTLYTVTGDLFAWGCVGIVLVNILWGLRLKFQRRMEKVGR